MPDVVEYEKGGLSDDEIQELQAKGHEVKELNRQYGNMQAILWDKMTNRVTAASDPRREGLSLVE
jgi:gamma-glutamyltranspeptidase/glutathione hydrolase